MKEDSRRPDVIVIRHFASKLNERGISRGWLGVGIDTEAAKKLVPQVAATLKRFGVNSLISSTLPRAEQSMELIADEMGGDMETESTSRLKTWKTGDQVAGKPEKETIPLRQRYIKNPEIPIPGGEEWGEPGEGGFMARYAPELRDVEKRRTKGEDLAMIGHGHHLLATPALMEDRAVDAKDLASLDETFPAGGVYGFFRDGTTVRIERLDKNESADKAAA